MSEPQFSLKLEKSLLEEMRITADIRNVSIEELTKWALRRMIFDTRGVHWNPKKCPTSRTETRE